MITRNRLIALALTVLAPAAGALDLQGELAWAQRVSLGTSVSGVVTAVPVMAGQQVAKGAVLVALDARPFRADLSGARAGLQGAEARLDEARREDERSQELYDRTLLSDHERQLAQIARVEAESAAAEARAVLSRAQVALERSQVKAPFDARVVAVNVGVGQAVVSDLQSQPLVVVADATHMLAEADIAASQLDGISVGQAAQVGLGGTWFRARVSSIGLEPVGRTDREALYRIQLMFEPSADRPVRAGLPAVLRLETP